jgi:2-aminoethylphosphonate-pyruvate transaminase
MSDSKKNEEKLLFTPGPLTTSYTVKEAALRDLGSRDSAFIRYIAEIRKKLVKLAHADLPEYEAVIIQGSGTFGIESVISSSLPDKGVLLNIVNGAYGRRISHIARIHSIPLFELVYDEDQIPDIKEIEQTILNNPEITHIALVHGETTTGLINPLDTTGEIASRHNKVFIVDAMSTFGAYDIDIKSCGISFLISSSNKCIEGIPGFSFVIAKSSELEKCKNQARTLSLDLYSQWNGFKSDGQFRFTPPVQAILAFHEALYELEEEGGILARSNRYIENNRVLTDEMQKIGFRLYLSEKTRGYIITSFLYPDNNFNFNEFYSRLNEKGFVIYPGKLSKTDCFRIGNIGQLFPDDIRNLTEAIKTVIMEMNIILK